MPSSLKTLITIPLLVYCSFALADTTEVYHWVDENGVSVFSQTGPNEASGEVRKLALEGSPPAGYDPDDDIFGVEEQAARMKALREGMEERRQARVEAQRRAEAQRPVPQYREQPMWGYGIRYPGYPVRPPIWPGEPVVTPHRTAPFLPSPDFWD